MNIWVTDDGDFEHDSTTNNLRIVEGNEEVRQIIMANLETIEGEWFLDITIGVPWFTEILQKNVSLNRIDGIIINVISSSKGVISLLTYDSSVDAKTRTFNMEFVAQTAYGLLNFNETLLIV